MAGHADFDEAGGSNRGGSSSSTMPAMPFGLSSLTATSCGRKTRVRGPRTLVFRPHDVAVSDDRPNGIAGMVVSELRHGPTRRLAVEVGMARHRIEIDVAAGETSRKGSRIVISPSRWRLFEPSGFRV